MLPLPTEASAEVMNVSTDRRHRFHTYNDHNRFRQFGFTQQMTVVYRRRGEGHGNLEWNEIVETLTPRLQSMLVSVFDNLIAS